MNIFGCSSSPNTEQPIIQLVAVTQAEIDSMQLTASQKNWIKQQSFRADPASTCVLPDSAGMIDKVLFGWRENTPLWEFARVFQQLPYGQYQITQSGELHVDIAKLAKIWGLCCYDYTLYKTSKKSHPTLIVSQLSKKEQFHLNLVLNATYQVRNWINTPAEDFGPGDISDLCHALAKRHQGKISQIVGDELLEQNYPLIHLVGRASARAPRMLHLSWGNPKDPAIALIGKGVCFDTGGVQVKPHSAMQTMKKDMGGAAHMIALAEMIMVAKLPVNLSLWIAAVDNSISANAFLPGDVCRARNGLSVEIGHTDAEGRLILADLIAAACEHNPQCIIDYATLTGAQRVALGMDLPAVFANCPDTASSLVQIGQELNDPLWPLPLFAPYKTQIESEIADLSSTGKTPYGGAITAALFLQNFLSDEVNWMHIDASCYHQSSRPARPKGGEAMALEALFTWVKDKFCNS